ncbi:GroES-like protein [Poronia punctata]|nr:GroES-like protein [Poronia punctata]
MSQQHEHDALVLTGPRTYEIRRFPRVRPEKDEITVNVKWTASTPLDLHRADGGLLVEYPMRLGSTGAGIVAEVGPEVKNFKVGDRVFGFAHQQPAWKTHQEYSTAPEWVFGKIPEGFSFEQAVTLPENIVTAFNTIATDLKLPTPWPKPADYQPPRADEPILIWGAASSVGQLTIEVLKYYGYKHIVATASSAHHAHIEALGATEVYDYRNPTVVDDLLGDHGTFPLIVDCIGHQQGTLTPISKIAQSGSVVAVMLPVILRSGAEPEYSMDATSAVDWAEGVEVSGVRTFFYWKNEMFREKLQTEIIPTLLAEGFVRPNRYQIVEGDTLLERATNGLNLLRQGVSGKKLIWRVSNE